MISKVSEIKSKDIAEYLRLDTYSDEELNTYLNIAKNYISNYTGIKETGDTNVETLDSFSDFVIVIYILCQDMYDNRCMYVDNKCINKTVQTILDMHTRNNL